MVRCEADVTSARAAAGYQDPQRRGTVNSLCKRLLMSVRDLDHRANIGWIETLAYQSVS
ncbi:unnamed protein product [Fusarium graminearum]|uniref:Chromosome 1, complete genome n=1 Tax=Gibberella zeae (strain ATCC MYA-4620 / CBS 123657 / FGSC 9075 / NRRL 31084 / PH-1) TaxID=229533 RepID=A0A1C3YIM2_GIBZE|nr:unnamed protein product [Fusarium graminearum]